MSFVVQVHRDSDDKHQTLGRLYLFNGNKALFSCKTLELPWKENASKISCIPTGEYTCRLTYSPKFKKELYLVLDTGKRSGIRIHPANYVEQLSGCIALGSQHKDLDLDGDMDVIHSGDTCKKFMQILDEEDFTLEIYNFTDIIY